MPSRRALDPASRHIADAWDDAKRHDPTLTMGEFARRTFPDVPEKREGGRRLGRILRGEGEPDARTLVAASYNVPVANVEYRNERGYVSYSNWLMPPGWSTFDAFRMQHDPNANRDIQAMIQRGRVRDSAPFGGDRRGRGRIAALRPVRTRQTKPHVGTIRAPGG